MRMLICRSILLISLFTFCLSISALACDCIPHSMKEDYKSVDFVIQGKVIKIKDLEYMRIKNTLTYRINPGYVDSTGYYVAINVSNEFKGSVPETLFITPEWTNCDFLFKKNIEYVIFGYKDSDNIYRTNLCTKTFEMNHKNMDQLKAILGDKN